MSNPNAPSSSPSEENGKEWEILENVGRTEDINQAWEEAHAAKPKMDLARDMERMARGYEAWEKGENPDFSLEDHPVDRSEEIRRKTAVSDAVHEYNNENEILHIKNSAVLKKTAEKIRAEAELEAEKAGYNYQKEQNLQSDNSKTAEDLTNNQPEESQRTEDINQAWEEAHAAKPKMDLARDVENTSRYFDRKEGFIREYLKGAPHASEWQPRMHAVNEAVNDHVSREERQGMSAKEQWQKTAEELKKEAMADAEEAGKKYQGQSNN